MKPVMLAAALLLALVVPAHAETCTGRVKNIVTSNDELYPKGTKLFIVEGCIFEQPAHQKRVLRTCPMGSHCRIEGSLSADSAVEAITSVKRMLTPYQEGMRDYREGLCYRARPYSSNTEEGKLWERGYEAHQTVKQGRRMDRYCYGTRGQDH